MKKYSREVVFNYVNGFDTLYDVDELENDYLFMIDVIDYTNDKRMYNLCSSSVKGNYDFVRFIILKFRDDIDFICDVFDYYYEVETDEFKKNDLLIIMIELLKNKDVDRFIKYKLSLLSFYTENKVVFDKIKSEDPDDRLHMGLGFYVIFDDCYASENLSSFFASNFINDIFEDNNITLEEVVHKRFKTFADLEKFGIVNFLLDFLSKYDDMLSDYVSTHLYLLDDLKKQFGYIKQNWDIYVLKMKKLRYDILYDRVNDYIFDNNCLFSLYDILCVIAKEYNLGEELASYFGIEDVYSDMVFTSSFADVSKLDFKNMRYYRDIKKIFCEVMFSDKPVEVDNYIMENKGARVIRLDLKNKKN